MNRRVLVKSFPRINLLLLINKETDSTNDADDDSEPEKPREDPAGTSREATLGILYPVFKKMKHISVLLKNRKEKEKRKRENERK
jgi:hypothetical protein